MNGRVIPTSLGERVAISRIWDTAHSLVIWQSLGTVMAPLGVSFHLLMEDQGLVLSAILVLSDYNWFMLCPWAMSFFQKLCPAPFPPVMFTSCCSVTQFSLTPWTAARQAFLSFTISLSLLKLMSIESVMPSIHLIFCCPLLLPPSIFPSIRVFSHESVLHIRWPKYWSFSFNISPSNECSGLVSFRTDWFDLLAVQGTLKSLFQRYSSKASAFSAQPVSWSSSHIHTWLPEKP